MLAPLGAALGDHPDPARALAIPAERRWIGHGLGHLDLLDRAEAYTQIRAWLAAEERCPQREAGATAAGR